MKDVKYITASISSKPSGGVLVRVVRILGMRSVSGGVMEAPGPNKR